MRRRDGKVRKPLTILGLTAVAMEDSPAANFMELTKNRGAMMFKHIDEVVADKIKEDSFVDDFSTGGSVSGSKELEILKL